MSAETRYRNSEGGYHLSTTMASLRRKPNSKFWIACYTDGNGAQRQVSTKELSRVKAQKIAEKFEATYRLQLTEAQARKVIADIYEEIRGEKLIHAPARDFLANWLESKKAETAVGSHKRYANAVDKLLKFLGPRADQNVAYVDRKDFVALRDKTADELTESTANTDLKILRIAFAQAVKDGFRVDNPAAAVKKLKLRNQAGDAERRPFTKDELKKLFAILTGEWLGICNIGLYTGQRLGDIAALHWKSVNFETGCITFRPQKKDSDEGPDPVIVPMADPLLDWMKNAHKERQAGPVFPNANTAKISADGQSRRLSAQFHELLVQAGLAEKRSKKNTGNGHSVRRKVSELSYHSFRHTTNSWLKAAGVPEAVVRDILGHDSVIVSRGYTHVDEETKQKAVAKLPKILEQ